MRLTRPTVGQAELKAVERVFESGWLACGPEVSAFEREFSQFIGEPFAVATNSCTSALILALVAINVQGKDVLVPAYTFPATANAVKLAGGNPVFVDIDINTFCINTEDLAAKVTANTACILPVHAFGYPCDMKAILSIGIPVIEDAACALVKTEPRGVASCFSFHPRKPVTTGEGGMITTASERIADTCRLLGNHGNENGRFVAAGYNFRMSDVNAAIGRVQLAAWPNKKIRLDTVASWYLDRLSGLPIKLPHYHSSRIWQSFVILLNENSAGLRAHLKSSGIETTFGTYSVPEQPFYSTASCPKARVAFETGVTLPLWDAMTKEDIDQVACAMEEYFG